MLPDFREVWAADFEFTQPAGGLPSPVCFAAREVRTGRLLRLGPDDLLRSPTPPVPAGPDCLFVSFFASAEVGCYLALGWPPPARILDLFVEFRCRTSGLPTPLGRGLLGALAHFGLPAVGGAEKAGMRGLAQRGGPYTPAEVQALLDYCQSDADALARLLPAMLPHIDLPRALLRGRFMTAAARMERTGVPVDAGRLGLFRDRWGGIKRQLVSRIDRAFGVFDGLTFKARRWQAWLDLNGLSWPRLPSGVPALDRDTFRDMARLHPAVRPVHELRQALSQLKLQALTVGADGRNRCLLSPFSSKTGRCQPSNSKFIFGPAAWLRSLIRPGPGAAVAYIDWSQQELAIAAALSGDPNMQAAYLSGDFYLTFAKMAGAVPAWATKRTHEREREQFKVVALGVLYGLSEHGLSTKLAEPARGRDLLRLHRETFRQFWRWSDAVQDHAMSTGRLQTVFGWPVHVGPRPNPRSLRNFPMQSHGAEMLRLACCEATERGIAVCAPVHDAVLIEAAADGIDEAVAETQAVMRRAGEVVLGGFPLRSEAKVVRHPGRYRDPRGGGMWRLVCELCGVPP